MDGGPGGPPIPGDTPTPAVFHLGLLLAGERRCPIKRRKWKERAREREREEGERGGREREREREREKKRKKTPPRIILTQARSTVSQTALLAYF